MRKLSIVILLLITLPVGVGALVQTQTPQPTPEQKARIAALAHAWEAKQQEADRARDKYLLEVYATLAELGLKPSETSVKYNDKGEPVFSRVESTKPPPPKPEE